MDNAQEKKETACVISSVGMTDFMGSVPNKSGASETKGTPYLRLPPSKQRKAVNFWARKSALRALPGHCARCGAPYPGPLKNCDRCRASQKAYKDIMRRKKLCAMTPRDALALVEALARRVASLEIAVARLQLDGRESYKRGFRVGFAKGRNNLTRNIEALRGQHAAHRAGEQTSRAELAALNHAFG